MWRAYVTCYISCVFYSFGFETIAFIILLISEAGSLFLYISVRGVSSYDPEDCFYISSFADFLKYRVLSTSKTHLLFRTWVNTDLSKQTAYKLRILPRDNPITKTWTFLGVEESHHHEKEQIIDIMINKNKT